MEKKNQRRRKIAAFLGIIALSSPMLFPRAVQAKEETGAKNPYLVDDFEGYGEDEGLLAGSWATNGEEKSSYTIALTAEQVYEGAYALEFRYRQSKIGWGGCEIAKVADWSGCNALQFWVVPDDGKQRAVVQINTAAEGSFEAYLLDYEEYAKADTPLLVTLPFSAFVNPVSGKALTGEAAAEVYSIGFWVSALPDSGTFDADGYMEGALILDCVRAVNVIEEQGAVLERWLDGRFLGDKALEDEAGAPGRRKTAWLVAAALISGIIFIISSSWFVALAGKRRQGVDEDGNDREE